MGGLTRLVRPGKHPFFASLELSGRLETSRAAVHRRGPQRLNSYPTYVNSKREKVWPIAVATYRTPYIPEPARASYGRVHKPFMRLMPIWRPWRPRHPTMPGASSKPKT